MQQQNETFHLSVPNETISYGQSEPLNSQRWLTLEMYSLGLLLVWVVGRSMIGASESAIINGQSSIGSRSLATNVKLCELNPF